MNLGDLILSIRELGPDPCQSMPAPRFLTATAIVDGSGALANNTYYLVITNQNAWGESIPSTEIAVTLTGGQNAIVLTQNGSPGANVNGKVYVGFASGNYVESVVGTVGTGSFTLRSLASATPGGPPARSSAYFPDTDGGFATVSTMYRWINESLKALARVTGGIQDSCGVASVSGQRRYVAPGQWLRFDQCFYDGWELDLGNKAETFRNRNLTANISISLMVDAQSDTTRIELYWTPSRTSGSTTTNGILLATDSNVAINAPTGWLLADGFAQVGSEIISYSAQTPTQLTNIIRGWNGTTIPSTLASGASVNELNIELTGYRMPSTYSVGQSLVTLGVPPGWEPFLKNYILGFFRDAEQERQEAQGLMKQATDGLEAWVKSNKPVAGPRQCRMYGDYGIRGLVPGGLTGGIIIP
jgi:hypothetical protein